MYCGRCGTKNAKTSKFCRECGRKLDLGIPQPQPDEELEGEQVVDTVKVGDLLFQAFQSYETNKLDEAEERAKEALQLDPNSTSGHSMLAMIFEKKGDLNAAVRHYQRVVAANPKSTADREKLVELRRRINGIVGSVPTKQTASEYLEKFLQFISNARPWPEAIGAAILAFIILAMVWPKPPQSQQTTHPQPPLNQQSVTAPPSGTYSPTPMEGGSLPFVGSAPQPDYNPPLSNAPAQAVSPRTTNRQSTAFPTLPRTVMTGIPPVTIEAMPRTEIIHNPAPLPVPSQESGSNVRIERSGSAPAAQVNHVDRARQLQMNGQYEEAIGAWRQALNGRRNTGDIHQQIAHCYQRLGRHSDAIQNFRSAISSYQQQIAAGSNADDAQRGITSSELGIKVSQREGG
ncbi:MAG: tetratricopeptide repeat protein [Armatimonadota bacterium]|nr:tetratricopeptide repeat protein [Armatimonadota bacterium]